MNIQAEIALPLAEQERRRKVVSGAAWSARMEGLGKPLPERVALDELWITGKISREERRDRIHSMMKARDERG